MQLLSHPGRHQLLQKQKDRIKHQEIHRYVSRGSSVNTTGFSASEKGVKTTVGLSPSKWYANITRKSYFSSD